MKSIVLSFLITALALGCSSDRKDPSPWELNNGSNNTTGNNTTANNTTANNTTANNLTCEGGGFECAPGCGGDYFMQSECVNGVWKCPSDGGEQWVPVDSCPPGSCFGLPYPGEICDNGFKCRPDLTGGIGPCEGTICLTCDGFEPDAVNTTECHCACTPDGTVDCAPPTPCAVTSQSDLPGVEMHLLGNVCSWTADELAAGVTIEYEIIIDAALAPVTVFSQPQDAGGCGLPGPAGLITFYDITSDANDRFCLCDTGLCAPNMTETGLMAGVHPGEFEWFGANWSGPSDTGNPMGPPFTADSATVTVTSIGTLPDGQTFRLETRMPITIRP